MLEAIKMCEDLTGRPMNWSYVEDNRVGDHIWWIGDVRRFQSHYPKWHLQHSGDARRNLRCDAAANEPDHGGGLMSKRLVARAQLGRRWRSRSVFDCYSRTREAKNMKAAVPTQLTEFGKSGGSAERIRIGSESADTIRWQRRFYFIADRPPERNGIIWSQAFRPAGRYRIR